MADTFVRRVVGAAMLNAGTYEEVEADRSAMPQAIAVIVFSSLAAGIGARGLSGGSGTLTFFVASTMFALMTWFVFAVSTFQIGAHILPTPDTRADVGELLRTLGFAAAPGLIQVFGLVPGVTKPVFALAMAWTIAASVVAVRQSLDYTSTTRAIAVCGIAWALAVFFLVVLGLLFSPTLSGFY